MTVRLRASIQSLVFVVAQAATLFGAAGRIHRRVLGLRGHIGGSRVSNFKC
jgi:hypothetical protein